MNEFPEELKNAYKHIGIQTPAMQELMKKQMARPLENDSEYISLIKLTPIAKEAQRLKEDGTVDLNVREISTDEFSLHDKARRERMGKMQVTRELLSWELSEEKRERAIHAFMAKFSMATIKDRFKAIMEQVKETVKYGYGARHED